MTRRGIAILAILIVGLGGLAWGSSTLWNRRDAAAPSWRYASVDQGSIVAAVSATGTINPTATAIVGSQVSGQVVEILADFNSVVKANDVLARLNSEQSRARLDAATADLAQTRAQLEIQKAQVEKVKSDIQRSLATRADAVANVQKADATMSDAERTLGRQQQLSQSGIASQVTLQQAQTAVQTQRASRDQARAQVRSVEAQALSIQAELKVAETQLISIEAQIRQREAVLRQIEVDIRNSEIRSPVDGIVIQRNIELGQTVAASLQAPTIFLVAQDLRRIEIYANIDEADIGRVQTGQAVTFNVTAYPAREFSGRIKTVRLGSQTVQNVVIYTAVIDVENTDLALKPGMTATVRILTERRENVLRIANSALRWRPPGSSPNAEAPATPNPFQPAVTGGPPGGSRGQGGGGGGQGAGQQMMERLAADLKLDSAQQAQVREIAREIRQTAQTGGPVDTPEARRERGRQFWMQLAERVKPVLKPEQVSALDAFIAERRGSGGQAAATGVPARLYRLDEEGKLQAVSVRIGATDGTNTEIISGAQSGDRFIIGGAPRPAAGAFRPPRGL
jgi:HlyD family secretion protein